MLYKIIGDTDRRISCGHLVRAGEAYFIKVKGKMIMLSLCNCCANNPKVYNTIKVQYDVVDYEE
jgi:hypothetical protein